MIRLGNKRMSVKVFNMDGVIFGAYKRSSAREHFRKNNFKYTSIYPNATYEDLQTAEKNIID